MSTRTLCLFQYNTAAHIFPANLSFYRYFIFTSAAFFCFVLFHNLSVSMLESYRHFAYTRFCFTVICNYTMFQPVCTGCSKRTRTHNICHCTIFGCSRITRSASEHTLYTWHFLLRWMIQIKKEVSRLWILFWRSVRNLCAGRSR